MRDQWTRRAGFLTGLFASLLASGLLCVADTLAALAAHDGVMDREHVLAVAMRVVPVDLLLAVPVGLWLGLTLYGVCDRPWRVLVHEAVLNLWPRPRSLETVRLARLGAMLLSVMVASGLLFAVTVPVFGRIVRAPNAAAVVALSALVITLLVLTLHPALRVFVLRLVRWRERLLGSWHVLLSLPTLLGLGLVGALILGVVARQRGATLLYAMDMTPLWWVGAYAGFALLGLLVACTGAVERRLIQLAGPLGFTLSNVLVGAGVVLAVQVIAEMGAHAGLLDGTGVASRVYSTISEFSSGSRTVPEAAPVVVVPQPVVEQTGSRAPDVILITVDALRADHLGVYGYGRNTSPNIDALARRGLLFREAYSPAPCTASSFAGLLTSRLPSRIAGEVQENEQFTVPEETPSFVEHFRRAGYHTVGLVPLVSEYLTHIRKGFDRFDNFFGNSAEFSDKVIRTLQREAGDDRPLFLWAHFLDVHYPYQSWPGYGDFGDTPEDRYDQEIAYTDSQLARVLSQLQWLGHMDSSIVVFSADHGEAFEEHGVRLHGDTLHQEQIHVPLIVAAPGLPRGEEFKTRVSLLDLGPTLADLAGVDRISYHTDGGSLLARLKGLDTANPTVMVDACRVGTQFALVDDYKLYYQRSSGAFYLYDLRNDAAEHNNLFGDLSDVATPMVQRLRKELAKAGER
ncbi:MAG: sulfatase [Pseudomonadota bacterium]